MLTVICVFAYCCCRPLMSTELIHTNEPIYEVPFTFMQVFGWPFMKQFALCYQTAVCLSVTLVYCGQTVGWIKMKLGVEVGLGPGYIVADGDPAPLSRGAQPPNFWPMWPNGWMEQDATWYGGRPRSRWHCIRWGTQLPTEKLTAPHFLANVNSCLRSLYAIARPSVICLPSVCLLSVCNVRAPYSRGSDFRQYFYGIRYLGHPWTSTENFTEKEMIVMKVV